MNDLPPHVGRVVDEETGYALVCGAVGQQGNPNTDPLCGQPAQWHIRWVAENTENGFACADHASFAVDFKPHAVHSVENSACGMPGSFWVDLEDDRSVCTMFALDEDPDRSAHAALTLGESR